MKNTTSRLDDLSHLVLSVVSNEGNHLDLCEVPDSRLKLLGTFLNDVPDSLKSKNVEHSLTYGLDYFSPGINAVILGGKNKVLPYIAARQVGPGGLVINCFSNHNHLEELQVKFAELADEQLAKIQFHYTPHGDLRCRYSEIEKYLDKNSVDKLKNYIHLESYISDMKREYPLVADNSVDIAAYDVPNFNIAPLSEDFRNMISEIYRILKKGGIFLFSLLLSDESALEEGYLCEDDIGTFTGKYKFYGLQWLGRSDLPYKVINGKEIRYHNFVAFKGKEGRCLERKQAVLYNGPWREVRDDDGHIYPRGKRVAVCDKTFNILLKPPYKGQFTYIHPYIDIPLEEAADFPCSSGILFRDPKETKGVAGIGTIGQDCCDSNESSDNSNGNSCCC
ncbi:MAG: class I SAM-dependent methyltransferase [Candidatus Aminicenantes bacterium]|nr:MAG: class I SAM-dependent methyltransferase [Candidatus Aminicenantes bacterium]